MKELQYKGYSGKVKFNEGKNVWSTMIEILPIWKIRVKASSQDALRETFEDTISHMVYGLDELTCHVGALR